MCLHNDQIEHKTDNLSMKNRLLSEGDVEGVIPLVEAESKGLGWASQDELFCMDSEGGDD